MAKAKNTKKSNVQVRDMKAKKDPKGGTLTNLTNTELKQAPLAPGAITVDVSSLNFKK